MSLSERMSIYISKNQHGYIEQSSGGLFNTNSRKPSSNVDDAFTELTTCADFD